MSIIKKIRDNKQRVDKNEKKEEICSLLMGILSSIGSRKPVWRFLKKLKIELSYDLTTPLLVYIQRK